MFFAILLLMILLLANFRLVIIVVTASRPKNRCCVLPGFGSVPILQTNISDVEYLYHPDIILILSILKNM